MKLTTTMILAAALFAGPACGSKSKKTVAEPDDDGRLTDHRGDRTGADREEGGSTTTVSADDGDDAPTFAAVYFEFDSATLTAEARAELATLAEWLAEHPKASITIEGHADERGTDEYNIALGQKRARVIQEHLRRLGVEDARLATISYGEERPAVTGDDEDAWARNRRGELVPDR